MKPSAEVTADIQSRLTRTWHSGLTGLTDSWPHAFPSLGTTSKHDLEGDFAAYQPLVNIISENKDKALFFPPVVGGVAVEGAG